MSVVDEGIAETILQPVRFKIIKCLHQSDGWMYIEQISQKLGESSRLISHHLDKLEDLGLVTSEFRIVESKNGRVGAGRYFTVTPKLRNVLSQIGEAVTLPPNEDRKGG